MIDIRQPGIKLINLESAAALVPGRNNRSTHTCTLTRWISRGVIAKNGERVYLSAIRTGCRWWTTASAVQEFLNALTSTHTQPTEAQEVAIK
jgi:hypothetical protein